MTSDDYFGLVSFSDSATVDLPPEKVTPEFKEKAKSIINNYQDLRSTNFSEGMLLGLKTANECDLPATTVVRVIMFTDGQPTHGVTDSAGLNLLLDKQAGIASVSAFGYGRDVNHDLLSSLSEKGKGNFAWVQNPDDALSAFGKELGGLLSSYAQNITIELAPHNGHQVTEVISDVEVEEETTGEALIKIPQILSEETMHIVVSMKLAAQKQPGPRQVNAIDLKLAYKVLDQNGEFESKSEEIKAKIQFVKAGEEQTAPTKAVDELVARAQLSKAQVRAEAAAASGNYAAAVMDFAGLDLESRGHLGVASVANHMKGMYATPTSFSASAGNRHGLRHAMRRAVGTSGLAHSDSVVLRDAGYGGGVNLVQEAMISNFVAPEPATPIVVTPNSTPNVPLDPLNAMWSPPAGTSEPVKVESKPSLRKTRSNQW
jgi:Ca-activated chloride channel homolog